MLLHPMPDPSHVPLVLPLKYIRSPTTPPHLCGYHLDSRHHYLALIIEAAPQLLSQVPLQTTVGKAVRVMV